MSSEVKQDEHLSSHSNIRHDWYQSLTHVVVTLLVKNVAQEHLKVNLSERDVDVTISDSPSSINTLNLHLLHTIVPNESTTRIFSSKVELKLKKLEGYQWTKLEGDAEPKYIIQPATDTAAGKLTYPSSNKNPRDWDKIVHEIKEAEKTEEPEGEEALNNLFQKIYADGSDETRKAMNKSFSESGGTVLSTNWNEIGTKKTEIKPPDGMEYKKWDQ